MSNRPEKRAHIWQLNCCSARVNVLTGRFYYIRQQFTRLQNGACNFLVATTK